MSTDKHRVKNARRKSSSLVKLSLPPEPKLSKKEKAEIEKAWMIEARRRIADYDAGKTKCIPHEEVMRRAYSALDEQNRLHRDLRRKITTH